MRPHHRRHVKKLKLSIYFRLALVVGLLFFLLGSVLVLNHTFKLKLGAAYDCLTSSFPLRSPVASSKSLCLGQNYSSGLEITSDNVTLDCNNLPVDGGQKAGQPGILIQNRSNINLNNCVVKGFFSGVSATGSKNINVQNGDYSYNSIGSEVSIDPGSKAKAVENLGDQYQKTGAGIYFENVIDSKITAAKATKSVAGIILITSKNITVENGDYSNNSGWGVKLQSTTNSTIKGVNAANNNRWCLWENLVLPGCESAGILLIDNSDYNIIQNNYLNNSGDGFYIDGCGHKPSNHNTVSGNVVTSGADQGMTLTANSFEATFSSFNQFFNNTSEGANYGFWLGYSDNSIVRNNNIKSANGGAINIANSRCNAVYQNTTNNNEPENSKIWKQAPNAGCEKDSGISVCENNLLVNNKPSAVGYSTCTNTSETSLPTSCQITVDPNVTEPPAPPPPPGNTGGLSQSKLGVFILSNYSAGAKQVVAAGPRVIKVMDTHLIDAVRDYKQKFPNGVVIMRIYVPQSVQYPLTQNAEEAATAFWTQHVKPEIDKLSAADRKLIDYLNGPNYNENFMANKMESDEELAWYNAFWTKYIDLVAAYGMKTNMGEIYVAGMDAVHIPKFIGALQKLKEKNGIWSYHGYTTEYSTDPNIEKDFSLHYRSFYDYLKQNHPELADLKMALTEAGVDKAGNPKTDGWKERGSDEQYEAWLKWFDTEMKKDDYIIGATLFQIGDSAWSSFNLEPIAGWLAQYIGGQTQPVPTVTPGSPQPTTPPGQPTNPPNPQPTGVPQNKVRSLKIIIHTGDANGPVWTDPTPLSGNPYDDPDKKNLLIYIQGPTQKGRFGEMLAVPGAKEPVPCVSRKGFTYGCQPGTIIWKGSDNKSGTSPGAYSAAIFQFPAGWADGGTTTANGNLGQNDAELTLNLVIRKAN